MRMGLPPWRGMLPELGMACAAAPRPVPTQSRLAAGGLFHLETRPQTTGQVLLDLKKSDIHLKYVLNSFPGMNGMWLATPPE